MELQVAAGIKERWIPGGKSQWQEESNAIHKVIPNLTLPLSCELFYDLKTIVNWHCGLEVEHSPIMCETLVLILSTT